jgi:hypothetical protein
MAQSYGLQLHQSCIQELMGITTPMSGPEFRNW